LNQKKISLFAAAALLALSAVGMAVAQRTSNSDTVKYVKKIFKNANAEMVLAEPPDSRGFHSGFVALQAGQDMHEHTTGTFEEILIVLEGQGEALFNGQQSVTLEDGVFLYIPPQTRHSVKNTGAGPMKYIYVAAPAPDTAP
jgi:quercetin dioxygenase-like cupin family protein